MLPEDYAVVEVYDRLKEIGRKVRDLLETVQILGIMLEEHTTVHIPEVCTTYEELCNDRRALQESVSSLSEFFNREFKP